MKKRVRIYKKPCYECGGQTHMQSGGQFEPHMMYDPNTGKGYPAERMEDHFAMKEQGFLHEDELPKKNFGGAQFGKRLAKELKNSYKPFSSTAPQNQNTDEVVGERKNIFTSTLSNNAFKKYAEEEQQSLQQLHQQMKMGGPAMYDQYGGQYSQESNIDKYQDGGEPQGDDWRSELTTDQTDPEYVTNLLTIYKKLYGTKLKGFGNINNANKFSQEGPVENAALAVFLEAILDNNDKALVKAAQKLDELKTPEWYDVGWLQGTNQEKIKDLAAITREEARGVLYDETMSQMKKLGSNFEENYYKPLYAKLNEIKSKGTPEQINRAAEDILKLKRIKNVIEADKNKEAVKYYLPNQIDWNPDNWGQAYEDFDLMLSQYGTDEMNTNYQKDFENIYRFATDFSNKDDARPISRSFFINDDFENTPLIDNYLKFNPKFLDEVTTKKDQEYVEPEEVNISESSGADNTQGQPAPAPAPVQQPKVSQPKVQQPRARQTPEGYIEPSTNEIQKQQDADAARSFKERYLKAKGMMKGGSVDKYQFSGEDENTMNISTDTFYSDQFKNQFDAFRSKFNDGSSQNDIQYPFNNQTEEQPEMFPPFENLKWYDKQTSGFDKYQVGREVFAPFRNLSWKVKEGVNNMFANPNKDYGYSTMDGTQIRMNRKGDEKIDLAGTYANAFRQNPWGTAGATLGALTNIGSATAKNINRMREDNMYNAFNQRMKTADRQFSPVDNPLERGNWTTNQGYFNPDLMTMQPWFTGQNYQYGGNIVNMTDKQIEEFLRAGGQIEYLD